MGARGGTNESQPDAPRRRAALAAASALASVLAVVALLSALGAPAGAVDGDRLLPDLRTVPLGERSNLELKFRNGHTRLRFDNTVSNHGAGPLQISASLEDGTGGCATGDYVARQDVFSDTDGDGEFGRGPDGDGVPENDPFGCMSFHPKPGHNHWHVLDFTEYELLRWGSGRAVAERRKQGFCLLDGAGVDAGLPGASTTPHYLGTDCGGPGGPGGEPMPPGIEGISIGWADLYSYDLAGQAINITGLPRGRYCLRSRVDPANRIAESDDRNNALRTALRIVPARRAVELLDRPCA